MSKRLSEIVSRFLVRKGQNVGMAELCLAVDRCPRTIERWIKNGVPKAHDAFKLAVAAGLSEEEALELVNECPSEANRRTA